MTRLPIIAVTPGEPAGIGPDICVRLAENPPDNAAIVFIGDPALLANRARQLRSRISLPNWSGAHPGVFVLPVATRAPVTPGRLDTANAKYVIETLERATRGCLNGEFNALVTGPVHKGAINDAGISFTGHTEFLCEQTGAAHVVMMLAAPSVRVALVTTHLPLAQVAAAITPERLTRTLEILHADLRTKFGIEHPRIRVCGLNPHAGEGGHLGNEEMDVIAPVIRTLTARGMRLEGPVPADTAFLPEALARTDAILAMYHDQGLAALKALDFAHAINITLGLPMVRTSVDHGTALSLAGGGHADDTSLREAVRLAIALSSRT